MKELIEPCFDEELLDFIMNDSIAMYDDKLISSFIIHYENIIADENASPHERALACVWKFQFLMYQYKLAPKLLEKALCLCPDMPEALIRMGIFFYKKDQNKEKMLEYINRVIDIQPSYPYAWLLRAAVSNDNSEQLISDCVEYSRLNPNSPLAYELCGSHLKSRLPDLIKADDVICQNIEEAIKNFTEAIRIDPHRQNNYCERGQLYILKDQIYRKEEYHSNTLSDIFTYSSIIQGKKIERNSLEVFFRYADVDLKEQYCTEILRTVSPEKNIFWLASAILADCFNRQSEKETIETCTLQIARHPDDLIHRLLYLSKRASIYEEKHEYEKALEDYAAVIEQGSWMNEYRPKNDDFEYRIPSKIDPLQMYNKRLSILRCMIIEEYGKDESGIQKLRLRLIEEFTNAIKISLHDPFNLACCYRGRAEIYSETHEYDKAIEDYSAVIEVNDEYFLKDAYKERLKLYLRQGNKEKAFDDFVKMTETNDSSIMLEDIFVPKYELVDE